MTETPTRFANLDDDALWREIVTLENKDRHTWQDTHDLAAMRSEHARRAAKKRGAA